MFFMHSPLFDVVFILMWPQAPVFMQESFVTQTLNSVDMLWTSGQGNCSLADRFLGSSLGPCNATTLPATPHFELVVIIDGHCYPVAGAAF